jgi:hypothetical protein
MRKVLFLLVLLFDSANASAAQNARTLDRATLDRLEGLAVGASLTIDRFPDGFGGQSSLRFERVEIYAPDARIVVVDENGEHEIARSKRVELIGSNASGDVRASLAFDPGFENVNGVGTSSSGTYVIGGTRSASGMTLRAAPSTMTLPAGVVPKIVPSDDALPSGRAMPDALTLSMTQAPDGALRGAVVAVDTDNELMSERFNNNPTAATSWIADLFTTMNVMYQRDVNVMLLQGTTFLRTTADPYVQNNTPADGADLSEFGTYWQVHYGNVPRSFAMLLSGKSPNGNQASGIAWVNAYCETQSQSGSYSVNQVFTNAGINVSFSALIVAHELGHNFGAYHTHCTNITNGNAPTGTNTIDKCWNESGCYSGATSCPTSGPGAPAGTVMSYCNQLDCGPTGQNVLIFHPTQINVLNALIAQNTPSCLSATTDIIFKNGFD